MTKINVVDATASLPLTGVHETPEGYLVADVFALRTGIQLYTRDEMLKMGVPDADLPKKDVIKLYRSPEEVFHKDSLASFAYKPLTDDHPTEAVVADNWKKLAIGETGGDILRDGEKIRIPMTFRDAAGINAVKSGKRQVSAGYSCDIEMVPGKAADGVEFDGQQRGIRGNHIAAVHRGRAGEEFRVGDSAGPGGGSPRSQWGLAPIQDADIKEVPMTLRNILVDGFSVETTDAGAQAITKLQGMLTDAQAQVTAKDRELAEIQGKLDKATAAVPTADAIAKLVSDRAALITDARSVAAVDYSKLTTDADIRRAAVAAKMGDAAVEGRSDAFVEVRFEDLVKDAAEAAKKATTNDPVRRVLGDGAKVTDGVAGWDDVMKANGFAQ